MLTSRKTSIDRHAVLLERAKNGKRLYVHLLSRLTPLPDPEERSLAEREKRFFAAAPDDPHSYEESYEDIFDDPYAYKRSEKEKQDLIKKTSHARTMSVRDSYIKRLAASRGDYYQSQKRHYNNYDYDYDYRYRGSEKYSSCYEYDDYNLCNSSPYSLKQAQGHRPLIDIQEVISAVHKNIAPKESIRAIVLMGSAAKRVERVKIRHNALGMRQVTHKTVIYNEEIHDVDLLVVLEPKTEKKVGKVASEGLAQQYCSDGYGGYTSTRSVEGLYDIFAVTADEYEESLHRGDSMPLHVSEEGVLLLGTFPYPTSRTTVTWSLGGKAKWQPQRIVESTTTINKRG